MVASPALDRSPRIALAGFVHESNSFAPSAADMAAFLQGGGYLPLCRGAQILTGARDVNLPVAGALAHAEARGWDLVPLIWAGAVPSAPVTAACYQDITDEIIAGLRRAGPLDGVFLDLHGAMMAEGTPDGEGALLARIRAEVRPDVPVVAALDLHGNLSAQMVGAADRMVGFRTYPHVDMAETGRRAAVELDRLLAGAPSFTAFRQLDFLIPIAWQATDADPAAAIYALLDQADAQGLCASVFMGFPAADFTDCRPSVIVHADSQDRADAAADRIAEALRQAEPAFNGRSYGPEAGVAEAQRLAASARRPVVLVDTQDNPGAGGNSDTTGMLRALIDAEAQAAAIGLICDPEAAAAAHAAGTGATITLPLGGRSNIPGDAPLTATFTVEALSDGRCHATGPYYGGAHLRLGPSACLRIGGVRVAVASEKAQMADRQMFRFLGIVPEDQAILVVKSSNHFRADFTPIAQAILTCTAPGPMPISPASLPFRHLAPGLRLEPGGAPFIPPAQG
ncbi:M81 family metallopeptidase (plasmid) [Paracoccus liaowanqingii]|uniref:Microcystinase C n=1 Tax=Paracoccus liaowanqingii TaxID=2560053 RepID=A0A4Y5SUJ4_9RHOB|nr:M81 family metallopeptidase [Paracoccus liaowanqingii]QDA36436.1 M81 family metallopeptidase [Paracoccus liaowanqingii]